ncbi:hypothetical protein GGF50DRAFT_116049 [Schizophyllum commune]
MSASEHIELDPTPPRHGDVHRVLRSIEETHRVLRSITTAHLEPLHKLQGWNFIDAWFQCAEAHYLAWTHGIHHQDPSLNNLMYRGQRDGKICPILDDWDLAIEQTHTGLQRTGTMQFMAFARLESEAWGGYRVHEVDGYRACEADGYRVHGVADQLQHLYRHDLEAFFYIFAWVLCCYKEGRRLDPLPPLFETWTMNDGTWTEGEAKGDETWTMGNARACSDSNARACSDSNARALPTDSWSSAMVAFADIIRLFFTVMLRKLAGSPESWMQSRLDNIRARSGGRALPPSGRALPPPQEDDKPTEIWEDFCDAMKEGLLTLSTDNRTNLKKEDLPPRLASFLPDSQTDTPL